MYCPKCGQMVPNDATSCPTCGAPIKRPQGISFSKMFTDQFGGSAPAGGSHSARTPAFVEPEPTGNADWDRYVYHELHKFNDLALAGFILSLLGMVVAPLFLISLPLSIIGCIRIYKGDGTGMAFAIAGIAIPGVEILFMLLVMSLIAAL